jgi:hypothetical protein
MARTTGAALVRESRTLATAPVAGLLPSKTPTMSDNFGPGTPTMSDYLRLARDFCRMCFQVWLDTARGRYHR